VPPSPSLQFVHAAAGVSRRFVSWLRRACKNYGELIELEAVVDNRLREERVEALTGEEKTRLTQAIMDYEKILADLGRLYKSDAMETFRISGEGLIKWVGDEIISLGYTGMRERSAQYWVWDIRTGSSADEIPLPVDKKMRNVLDFYRVETYEVFHVPTQEEAERELLDFLENIKKWSRERLVYIVKKRYPLTDDTGGFWTVVRKVVELQSLRDVWDDFMEDWNRIAEDELMKMPQFQELKTFLMSDFDAERCVREIVEEAKKELVDKYAERIADPDAVKSEFLARAKQIFLERVAPETKIAEVYEEVKSLIPAEKVELTRAGLWKAIRWLFLHPAMELEAFASGHVFPLGFATEEARAIALKIAEKVTKILVYPPSVAAPPKFLEKREFFERIDAILRERVAHYVEGEKSGFSGTLHYEAPQFKEEYARIFSVNTVFAKFRDDVEKEKATAFDDYLKSLRPEHYLAEVVPNRFDIFSKRLVDKMRTQLLEEAVKKARPAAPVIKHLTEEEVLTAIPPFDEPMPISFEALREQLKKLDFDIYSPDGEKRLRDILVSLEREGTIYEPRPGSYKWTEEVTVPPPLPPRIEFVKVRFLKDMPAIVGADLKVYGPFAKDDVVELPKVNAEVIVKQEIATYTIMPPELPAKEIDALRTVVKVKADDLGLEWSDEVWTRFWKEYEARARELWSTKHVTYLEEEVESVLKAVAAPITPPAVRRERIRRPLRVEVPVEAPAEVFVTPVTIPRVPISKLPFPRAPSTEEQAILWDAFRYEMARLGQDPFRWRDNFKMHVLDRPYPDWATIVKNFSDFVEAIRTEKPFRLLPLVTLPMPWREEEEQRKYDAILHFIATKLYASMDELLHALFTYGVEVTEDDIKKAVKKGFAEKNLWLTSVGKETLESLTGEKL